MEEEKAPTENLGSSREKETPLLLKDEESPLRPVLPYEMDPLPQKLGPQEEIYKRSHHGGPSTGSNSSSGSGSNGMTS